MVLAGSFVYISFTLESVLSLAGHVSVAKNTPTMIAHCCSLLLLGTALGARHLAPPTLGREVTTTMPRQAIRMALLAFSAFKPNRCLSFQSAALVVARAQHRAPSIRRAHLMGTHEQWSNHNCRRRRRHECFSALSSINTGPPPENPQTSASIKPNVQIYPEQHYTLCYDGRSRRGGSNGGAASAGSGTVLYDSNGIEIWSSSQPYAGDISIYEASYRGLISGLRHAKLLGLQHINITGCNELLHKQIEGLNQVKKPSLKEYYHEVMSLKEQFSSFEMNFVNKTKNERAYQLAHMSMDQSETIEKKTKKIEEVDEINFMDIDLDPISESVDQVDPDKLYILRFDGSSRGNPGVAGAGMVLYNTDGNELWSGCQYLGEKNITNEAGYIGLITGLRVARILGIQHIFVQSDVSLILRQMEGKNRVNSAKLKPFYDRAMSLSREFASFHTSHIERSQNARADELANEAMNAQGSSFEVNHVVKTTPAISWSSDVSDSTEEEFEHYIVASLGDDDDNNTVDIQSETPISEDVNRDVKKLDPQKTYVLRFDGGSRGNPGKAGAGIVLYDGEGGSEIWSGNQYVGDMVTNNEAEYSALIVGLRVARSMGVENVLVQGDSQLILRQIDGVYKVKSEKLRSYYEEVMTLRREFASFRTNHIERAQNARADALANEAMDTQSSTIQIDQVHKATSIKVNQLISRGKNDDVNSQDDETETVNNPGAASRSETMSRLDPQKTCVLFFDGGSRGNPGIAGAGMVLYDDSTTEIWSGCQYLGEMSTNNEAEYRALITGLQIARSMGVENVLVQGDSDLILRQIDGVYKVKSPKLRPYYDEAMILRREFASFRTNHIERARNSRADELANEAMDNKCSRGIDVSQ